MKSFLYKNKEISFLTIKLDIKKFLYIAISLGMYLVCKSGDLSDSSGRNIHLYLLAQYTMAEGALNVGIS